MRWRIPFESVSFDCSRYSVERVKQAAQERSNNIIQQVEQDAQRLLEEAKYKANEILRQATSDNAKSGRWDRRVEEQEPCIPSTPHMIESHWLLSHLIEDILRPTATFRQVMKPFVKKWWV